MATHSEHYSVNNKIFTSIDDKHSISISIINNTAYFAIEKLEIENYKTFLLILKECFEYMNIYSVEFIKQQITPIDIELFKRSEILVDNTLIYVKTKIND